MKLLRQNNINFINIVDIYNNSFYLAMQSQSQNKSKRLLIVVGKMGHGKSSFVRTLTVPKGANPFDQKSVKMPLVSSGLKSVTLQSSVYVAHPSHNLTGDSQPLYVIDTEGLDSNDSISLVIEDIDELIKQNCFDLVGIAYVVDLSAGRLAGKNNQSYILNLLNYLKIRKVYRDNLVFFVATNWRACCKYGQQEQKISEFQNYLFQNQIQQKVFKKTVYWQSGPQKEKSFAQFSQTYFKKQGRAQLQNQWKKLSDNLQIQLSFYYPFKEYVQDNRLFFRSLSIKVKEAFKEKFIFAFEKTNFVLDVRMEALSQAQINSQIKDDAKKGVGMINNVAKFFYLNEDSSKAKIGNITSKVLYGTNMASMFCRNFLPTSIATYLDGATASAREIVNAVDQQLPNPGENNSLSVKDIPLALASIGLLVYQSYQFVRKKQNRVISNTAAQIEFQQRKRLKEIIELIQRSLIEAQLYSKIVFEYPLLKLKQPIESVQKITVRANSFEGELSFSKPIKPIIAEDEALQARLEVEAWKLTFQSFDKIYKKEINQFYDH